MSTYSDSAGKDTLGARLGTPINMSGGLFLGHVGTVEDITDRKQAEYELHLLKFLHRQGSYWQSRFYRPMQRSWHK